MVVDAFVLVNNMLSVIAPYVIVQYHNKIDIANIGEWLGSAGTTNESFCMASEGSFASEELVYDEGQSGGLHATFRGANKLQERQGVPIVARTDRLERSDRGIELELSNNDANCSLATLTTSD